MDLTPNKILTENYCRCCYRSFQIFLPINFASYAPAPKAPQGANAYAFLHRRLPVLPLY